MLYIYFLLYSVHLIIYRGTGNRWAVCAHRWAFLLVLVCDRFRRCAVYAHRLACLLVLVGDSPDGGRCMLIGWRASWCWWVIGSDCGRCVIIGGRSSGVGG